jgi:hypothetical protein
MECCKINTKAKLLDSNENASNEQKTVIYYSRKVMQYDE